MNARNTLLLGALLIFVATIAYAQDRASATTDNGKWLLIDTADLPSAHQHLNHASVFGKYVDGYNRSVLKAIDIVQAHAMDGGGYFTGMKAKPTESPIGYELKLFGKSLLDPPRTTSYCSGSSYGVLIEALNLIFPDGLARLSADRYESLRMQEPDGGRREDQIKFWGKWNDDGWGTQYALVQYSGMGEEISPERARPGDFANISWTSGLGHSVVFLGWFKRDGQLGMVFWSSQKSTNGFGDVVMCPLSKVKSVKIVRLSHPENVFTFDVQKTVIRDLPGDIVDEAGGQK
ncbi:MAG TPA: hypothetical protein VMH23_15375 [Bacteroidota bacterium]|nr:hypothetical protein [Bacteroidota bacterium]